MILDDLGPSQLLHGLDVTTSFSGCLKGSRTFVKLPARKVIRHSDGSNQPFPYYPPLRWMAPWPRMLGNEVRCLEADCGIDVELAIANAKGFGTQKRSWLTGAVARTCGSGCQGFGPVAFAPSIGSAVPLQMDKERSIRRMLDSRTGQLAISRTDLPPAGLAAAVPHVHLVRSLRASLCTSDGSRQADRGVCSLET